MKKNRKLEIITTAAKLFKEKGYKSVSMRDLAKELGIKASSLYNHITSKEEILSLIIMDTAAEFTNHITQIVPRKITTAQKLENIIEMHVEMTLQKPNYLACLNNDWHHLDEENRKVYLEMRSEYENNFKIILNEGIVQGELKNANVEIILFTILSTLRTLYLWYSKHGQYKDVVLKKELSENLLSGIVS